MTIAHVPSNAFECSIQWYVFITWWLSLEIRNKIFSNFLFFILFHFFSFLGCCCCFLLFFYRFHILRSNSNIFSMFVLLSFIHIVLSRPPKRGINHSLNSICIFKRFFFYLLECKYYIWYFNRPLLLMVNIIIIFWNFRSE